jgi:hypothetical protein
MSDAGWPLCVFEGRSAARSVPSLTRRSMNLYWRGTRRKVRVAQPGPGRGHGRREDPAKSRTRRWSNLTRRTCDSEDTWGIHSPKLQSRGLGDGQSTVAWTCEQRSSGQERSSGTVAGRLGGACQSRRSRRSAASESRVSRPARLRPGCHTAEPRTPMKRRRSCRRRPGKGGCSRPASTRTGGAGGQSWRAVRVGVQRCAGPGGPGGQLEWKGRPARGRGRRPGRRIKLGREGGGRPTRRRPGELERRNLKPAAFRERERAHWGAAPRDRRLGRRAAGRVAALAPDSEAGVRVKLPPNRTAPASRCFNFGRRGPGVQVSRRRRRGGVHPLSSCRLLCDSRSIQWRQGRVQASESAGGEAGGEVHLRGGDVLPGQPAGRLARLLPAARARGYMLASAPALARARAGCAAEQSRLRSPIAGR